MCIRDRCPTAFKNLSKTSVVFILRLDVFTHGWHPTYSPFKTSSSTSKVKQKCKRGFATKKEAQEWERMFQLQNSSDLDMSFEAFTELYIRDVKNRLKENTWLTKEHIIRTKILPFFGKLKISEISTKEIITWQNEMLAYRDEKKKPYSQTHLKTLHNQLSAIFNHAVRLSLIHICLHFCLRSPFQFT